METTTSRAMLGHRMLREKAFAASVCQRPCTRTAFCMGVRSALDMKRSPTGGNSRAAWPIRYQLRRQAVMEPDSTDVGSCDPNVGEVMTTDMTLLKAETSIRDAVQALLERKVSGAPVVDDNNVLVGVFSESDVLWKEAGARDHFIVPPVYLGLLDTFLYVRDEQALKNEMRKVLARSVGEAMSTDVVTITPDALLPTAADLMLSKKVNRLPVVDADNRVIGVLTRSDVLRGMLGGACSLF